jgi:signal transduction histidine kinase
MNSVPISTSDEQLSVTAYGEPDRTVSGKTHQGFWSQHPQRADALLAAGYALPAVAASVLVPLYSSADWISPTPWALGIVGALTPVAAGVALLFRRRAPLQALVVTTVMMLITFSHPADFASVAVACALYSTAVYRSAAMAWVGFGGSSAALLLVSLVTSPSASVFWDSGQIVIVLAVGVLVGLVVSGRRSYVRSLIERAEQLKRERDQQALLAAAAERASIAREMHDIVSHSLTVMITLAHGAAEMGKIDPDRATGAMRQVAQTGITALADLRRMLGVLEITPDAPGHAAIAPQPNVAALPALFERFRAAGLPVTATSSGVPPEDLGQQLAIYRLIQESLTNSLKHASGANTVTVALEYSQGAVSILVDDDGHAPALGTRAGGRGLLGMHERVALYGGTIHAGPKPNGGWRVRAQFRLAAGATA